MDNGEDVLNLKEVKAFGEFEKGKFNILVFLHVCSNIFKKGKSLGEFAKKISNLMLLSVKRMF